MSDLWRLDAAALAAGFRAGDFTPVDALEACLARAANCQEKLNPLVAVDRGGARLAAGASRVRWARGKPLGPLDGVPVTLKDNLHAAGLATGWGSRLLQGFTARQDELPVARLRAAGAVIFGKTNLPEFAMQGVTHNLTFGTTRNPWNAQLTPGGSSGGAACAVAAGCGPLALATDGGGSIRRPASHCGVAGFKPSAGRVPRAGGLPDLFLGFELAGPIGRSVQDVIDLAGVLAGEPLHAPAPAGARILYVPRFGDAPVDAGIAAAVAQAAHRLEGLGHAVSEAPAFDHAQAVNRLWPTLSCAGLAWMLGDDAALAAIGLAHGETPDIALLGDAAQAALRDGLAAEAAALFELLAEVQLLKDRLAPLFSEHDFILTPATAALPWSAEETHPAQIAGQPVGPRGHAVFSAFANAAGLPAVAVPCGFAGGLPTGFQLVGRPGADAQLLAMALQYEQAHPWAQHWPEIA